MTTCEIRSRFQSMKMQSPSLSALLPPEKKTRSATAPQQMGITPWNLLDKHSRFKLSKVRGRQTMLMPFLHCLANLDVAAHLRSCGEKELGQLTSSITRLAS